MHCGWMAEGEWVGAKAELPPSFGDNPYTANVCPGYLVRRATVVEYTSAYAAFDKGALVSFYPEPSNDMLEAVLTMAAAWNGYSAHRLKDAKLKAKHG